MKIKLQLLLWSLVLVLVSACDDDKDPVVIERTVLIYIMGDNTLSPFVADDITEITEGAANVDLSRNNLLLYIDNGSTVKLVRINKGSKGVVVQELVQEYESDRNSVGLIEMKEVFSLVYDKYPAESYGLVLWSHGEGWKPGTSSSRWIGQDRDGNALLSISTLNEILKVFPYYDYILFDACFMQSIEVVYELRQHTDYFIGSPAEIPAPGAPYQVVVPALFTKNEAGLAVARSYYEYYNDKYNEGSNNSNQNWTAGVAISVIATSKLETLANATKNIIITLPENEEASVIGVLDYDRRSSYPSSYIGYYDFEQFIRKVATNDALFNTWLNAFKQAVPYAKATDKIYSQFGGMFSVTGFSGVSVYVPRTSSSLNASYHSFEWYSNVGWGEIGW